MLMWCLFPNVIFDACTSGAQRVSGIKDMDDDIARAVNAIGYLTALFMGT